MMDLDKKNWTFSALGSWMEVSALANSKNHKITNIYHLFICLWENSNTPFQEFIQSKGLSIKQKHFTLLLTNLRKRIQICFFLRKWNLWWKRKYKTALIMRHCSPLNMKFIYWNRAFSLGRSSKLR